MREQLIAALEEWRLGRISADGVADAILAAVAPPAVTPPQAGKDRRTRPWGYVARFWRYAAIGPELVGETDAEVMHGTGELPEIVRHLAAGLHGCEADTLPAELGADALKAALPQLRNNLTRGTSAVLRVPYAFAALEEEGGTVEKYLCQVDVYRVEA